MSKNFKIFCLFASISMLLTFAILSKFNLKSNKQELNDEWYRLYEYTFEVTYKDGSKDTMFTMETKYHKPKILTGNRGGGLFGGGQNYSDVVGCCARVYACDVRSMKILSEKKTNNFFEY